MSEHTEEGISRNWSGFVQFPGGGALSQNLSVINCIQGWEVQHTVGSGEKVIFHHQQMKCLSLSFSQEESRISKQYTRSSPWTPNLEG